ncbi:PIG-L domain-containing protein [Cephalotus follicularis]|uniref:N-acetylglucosaminylphosphatidylinositol deacetylase n=1 Tax=Cephalotus follicularis TaxID=3775 RepID=A0A1Q3BUF6_CEPFO|nr:PIG-L domain-containing protein [Cephalotus follicularis]
MSWLLIAFSSLLVFWIASLCKIFHASNSPSFSGDGGALGKRNVLLVIAHPDDESMFFSPTINCLISNGHNLHILCFSMGNADGMGKIRLNELYQACAVLKVPLEQVKILDHPDLQDGFGQVWNHNLLEMTIQEEIMSHDIDTIISFDKYGVSGHCNHRDVHYGVHMLVNDTPKRNIEVWELVSINILRKYSGPVDIWLSKMFAMQYPSGVMQCLLNEHPKRSFDAMAQHLSQWVWFRKLFVSFSSYTYVNTLRKVNK